MLTSCILIIDRNTGQVTPLNTATTFLFVCSSGSVSIADPSVGTLDISGCIRNLQVQQQGGGVAIDRICLCGALSVTGANGLCVNGRITSNGSPTRVSLTTTSGDIGVNSAMTACTISLAAAGTMSDNSLITACSIKLSAGSGISSLQTKTNTLTADSTTGSVCITNTYSSGLTLDRGGAHGERHQQPGHHRQVCQRHPGHADRHIRPPLAALPPVRDPQRNLRHCAHTATAALNATNSGCGNITLVNQGNTVATLPMGARGRSHSPDAERCRKWARSAATLH